MTDGWQGYDGLVDVGYDKHLRIKKYRKEGSPFTDGPVHVNGIESFWSYTKRRLARFNGVKANFELHLKECEWPLGKDPIHPCRTTHIAGKKEPLPLLQAVPS